MVNGLKEMKEGRMKRWTLILCPRQPVSFLGSIARLWCDLSVCVFIFPPNTHSSGILYTLFCTFFFFSNHLILCLVFFALGSYVSFLKVHVFVLCITLVTMILYNILNLLFLLSVFTDFPLLNSY